MAHFLITNGADVLARDRFGNTPYSEADKTGERRRIRAVARDCALGDPLSVFFSIPFHVFRFELSVAAAKGSSAQPCQQPRTKQGARRV